MIIDLLANAPAYICVHPLFEKAFAYINGIDINDVDPGSYTIEKGTIRAIFSEQIGVTEADSVREFECHNQFIDIQFCIRGRERFGWRPRGTCVQPVGEYDAEKDVLIYNDQPTTFFELCAGQFVILFPEDVHAPLIAADDKPIKKLVIKVLK
ncbi:YhcH/YjgK/YiaL family protein [soil metagenome]